MGGHVDTAHERSSRRRYHPGGEHPGGRGLAGAVRAQQPEDLPGPHVEVEPVDGGEVSSGVDLGQLLGVDDCSPSSAGARGDWLHQEDGSARGGLACVEQERPGVGKATRDAPGNAQSGANYTHPMLRLMRAGGR